MFFYYQLWRHTQSNRLYFAKVLDFKPFIFAFLQPLLEKEKAIKATF
jgi:hypothetical protein